MYQLSTTTMFLYIVIAFVISIWYVIRHWNLLKLIVKCIYAYIRCPGRGLELLGMFQDAFPDIFRVRFSIKTVYVLAKPEYYEKVLSSPLAVDKPEVYTLLDQFLGPNIFTAAENLWRQQRRLLNLSFSQKRIDSHSEIFLEEADNLAKELVTHASQKNLDLEGLMRVCFAQATARALFGVKFKVTVEDSRKMDRIFIETARRGVHLFYVPSILMPPMPKAFNKSLSDAIIASKSIIFERRKQLVRNKTLLQDDKPQTERAQKSHMLDYILECPEFTDERAMSEIILFLIAGNETSSATLMYACLLLAMHPDIQEKLYHDVVSICGLDDPITLEKLPKIDYAERIIKETLRLFPSAPIIGRYTQGDLDIGGRVIPKHSTVYLHIVYTHRDPRFWQEPLTFDPDRFLQENASKIYPFSYIPFSYGSRNCIAKVILTSEVSL
ncbi:unnamed protein product [Acanthoscelides obtectus]|uniref:Cytochrome P450 n=1 Tax=Acanthoscelides obtectus TaxID=200917 RepID=A0A9P0LNB9_ACAOB|nr:unnamed protein product [Acanthoscelides obtectus]CAK1677566.1 Cytochrome P450 4C1 [Acanthoscelides obtectus]